MAIETIQKIIKIDTDSAVKSLGNLENATRDSGQAFQSLKDYKKYLDDIRLSMRNMDQESQDYIDTEKKLRQETEKYNRILRESGSIATVSEKEYSELTGELGKLRKAFKDTSDAAQKIDVGDQISNVNSQLSNLDDNIGNYKNNVNDFAGTFTSGFKRITDAIGMEIPAVRTFGDALDKIYTAWNSIKTISAAAKGIGGIKTIIKGGNISTDTKEIENLTRATKSWQIAETGVNTAVGATTIVLSKQTQALSEVTKATKLANASLSKYLVTGNSADLATYVKSIEEEEIARQAATAATEQQTAAQQGLNAATAQGTSLLQKFKAASLATKIGIGAAAAAIVAIIAVIVHFVKKAKEAREEFIKWHTELNSLEKDAGLEVLILQDLSEKYKALNGDIEKQNQFLKENADEIEKTTLNINDLNDADEIFIKNTDKYIQALKDRAKAQAAEQLAVSKYAEMIEKVAELQSKKEFGVTRRDVKGLTFVGQAYLAITNKTQSEYQKEIDKTISDYEDNIGKLFEIRNKAKVASDDVLAAFTGKGDKETTTKDTFKIEPAVQNVIPDVSTLDKEFEFTSKSVYDTLKGINEKKIALEEENLKKTKEYTEEYIKLLKDKENLSFEEAKARLELEGATNEEIELLATLHQQKLAAIDNMIAEQREEAEKKRKAQIEALAKETLENRIAIEEEGNDRLIRGGENFNQKYLELLKQREEMNFNEAKARLELEGATNEEIETLEELHQKRMIAIDRKAAFQRANLVTGMVGQIAQATSDLMDAVADNYEEGTEENKKMQIAATTLNMFAGVSMAISQAMQAGPILGPILGAINAATVIASGIAQIKRIQQTTLDNASSQSTSAVAAASYKPDYSKNVTGESEVSSLRNAISGGIENSVNDIKVYVLEEDITKAQKKVSVRQSEATF